MNLTLKVSEEVNVAAATRLTSVAKTDVKSTGIAAIGLIYNKV